MPQSSTEKMNFTGLQKSCAILFKTHHQKEKIVFYSILQICCNYWAILDASLRKMSSTEESWGLVRHRMLQLYLLHCYNRAYLHILLRCSHNSIDLLIYPMTFNIPYPLIFQYLNLFSRYLPFKINLILIFNF